MPGVAEPLDKGPDRSELEAMLRAQAQDAKPGEEDIAKKDADVWIIALDLQQKASG